MFYLPKKIIRNTNKSSKVKGYIGEKYVNKYLSSFSFRLNNIEIPHPNKTQIDHIVVCDKGILVIETKNYSGFIIGNKKDKYWIQHTSYRKTRFLNPIQQNEYHLKALSSIFPNYKNFLVSIIVFIPQVKIKIERPHNIVFLTHLRKYINDLPNKNLSLEKQTKLYKEIKKLK